MKETRGVCSKEELNLIIEWVTSDGPMSVLPSLFSISLLISSGQQR